MAIMRLQFEESPTERVSSQPIPIGKPAPPCGGVEPCPASWRQLACNGLSEREVGRWGSSDQLMAEALGCFNGSPPADLWPQGNKAVESSWETPDTITMSESDLGVTPPCTPDQHTSTSHYPCPSGLLTPSLASEMLSAPPACADRDVSCELSRQARPPRQLAAHVQRDCADVDVACPKPNCGWKGRRMFLKTHLSEVCAFVFVPCSFAASGCPGRVPRGKLKSHLIDDIGNHLLLVAHENSQLRARMRQMGAAQTLLQSRVDNLETVVLVDEEEDDAAAAAAASEGSSS